MTASIGDNDPPCHLFLLASSRVGGNAESLAKRAASSLPDTNGQQWLRLSELELPPFHDRRHQVSAYSKPAGDVGVLLDATLAATDIVLVAPLYWYNIPAAAKLYLDHWSAWLRIPDLEFKARMKGKTMWVVSVFSGDDPLEAEPMFAMMRLTADYMAMNWGGSLLGHGNQPGSVFADLAALEAADRLFASSPTTELGAARSTASGTGTARSHHQVLVS